MATFSEIIQNKSLIFYLLLGIALVLTRIPLIGKYFRTVSTLMHEAAHAFTALVFNGEVIAVNLFADTSGNTITKSKSRFVQFLVCLAGYPVNSLVGLAFLYMISRDAEKYIIFILVCVTLILSALSIRNNYGLFWAISFILLNILILYFDEPISIYIVSVFYTLVIFTDALLSALILLIMSIKTPKKAGDATNLQKITHIPAGIWGLFFFTVACFTTYLGITMYFVKLPF